MPLRAARYRCLLACVRGWWVCEISPLDLVYAFGFATRVDKVLKEKKRNVRGCVCVCECSLYCTHQTSMAIDSLDLFYRRGVVWRHTLCMSLLSAFLFHFAWSMSKMSLSWIAHMIASLSAQLQCVCLSLFVFVPERTLALGGNTHKCIENWLEVRKRAKRNQSRRQPLYCTI